MKLYHNVLITSFALVAGGVCGALAMTQIPQAFAQDKKPAAPSPYQLQKQQTKEYDARQYQIQDQGSCDATKGNSTTDFSDVQSRITGAYNRDLGKSEDIQVLERPGNPGAGRVKEWLDAHNAALLAVVSAGFGQNGMQSFWSSEQAKCGGNLYCELAFRQQAIAYIVGN